MNAVYHQLRLHEDDYRKEVQREIPCRHGRYGRQRCADLFLTPAGQQKKVPPSPATEKAGPDENDRCKRILSTVGNRCIIHLIQHVLVRRTDDAASFEIQFFDAVGRPAYDTGHSEQRRIDFLRQAHQLVDEA